jgi:putative SOS response-associated peptidase YedK
VGLWLDGKITMITGAPNNFMRPIHRRMSAILRDIDYAAWLDPKSPMTELQSLIAAWNWDGMKSDAIPKLTPDSPLSAPNFTREH